MTPTRITHNWSYLGFPVCVLENEIIRVTVVPAIGAKVHEFIYKPADRDLLFHHPRVELRQPVFGANVDNWWTGGLDDALPTGHPCVVGDEELPFLGEAWSLPWTAEQESGTTVRFTREGVITPFRIERRMELLPGESFVRMRHRITNIGTAGFRLIWGIHPGLPVGPQTRIQIPARRGVVQDSWPADRLGASGEEYQWPSPELVAPGAAPAGTWDHHYATELDAGWLAVWDAQWGCGFGMTFPTSVFKCVWVWMVDGGWRGLRCVAVVPWSGYPAGRDHANEAGNAYTLQPGQKIVAETRLIGFQTRVAIEGFQEDGLPLTAP
jgi:hypothetical protein